MEGLEYLGADEVKSKTDAEKAVDWVQTAAPGIIQASMAAAGKGGDKKTPTPTPKADGPSWWTTPQLGPLPGWMVVIGGAGVLTGVGFLIKRLAK